jgi:hypothetical protein
MDGNGQQQKQQAAILHKVAGMWIVAISIMMVIAS